MRTLETDKYIEELFGEPIWEKAFIDADPHSQTYGKLLTPFKNVRLWRVDEPFGIHPLGTK